MKFIFVKIVTLILSTFFLFLVSNAQESQSAENSLRNSRSYIQKGDFENALKEINEVLKITPNYIDALFIRATINNKKGDKDAVLIDYNKIIEIDPYTPHIEIIYTNRSAIYLQKGEIDKALEDLDKAVAINSKVSEIYIARAVVRVQKGDLDGALADYEKSIELNPTFAASFLGRAYFRYQKGDFDGALADYNKAIELKPDYADLFVSRGIILGLKNNFSDAISDIQKGANLNSKSVSNESRGNFNSPYEDLNQFITKNSNNAQAYLLRGILHIFQNRKDDAESDFNTSLKLNSKLKIEVKRIRKELNFK